MTVGLRIYRDNGNILQIDSNHIHLELEWTGLVSGAGGYVRDYSARRTSPYRMYALHDPSGNFFRFEEDWVAMGDHRQIRFPGCSASAEVFLYDRPDSVAPGGTGLTLYREDGTITFNSNRRTMEIATVHTGSSPDGGTYQSASLPTGKYAIAQLCAAWWMDYIGTWGDPNFGGVAYSHFHRYVSHWRTLSSATQTQRQYVHSGSPDGTTMTIAGWPREHDHGNHNFVALVLAVP